MIPAWLLDVFAAVMLVVAAVSAARLAAARLRAGVDANADVDGAHLLMGISMAGMLASGLHTLPNNVWVAIFVAMTVWFAWRVYADSRGRTVGALAAGHHLPHLVHSAAMVYMFAAVTAGSSTGGAGMAGGMGGMGGMGTLRVPTLGLIFILLMTGWVVVDLDRISRRPERRAELGQLRSVLWRHRAAAVAGPVVVMPVAVAAVAVAQTAGPASGSSVEAETATGESATDQPEGRALRGLLDHRTADGCRIAMGVTMALMLVLML